MVHIGIQQWPNTVQYCNVHNLWLGYFDSGYGFKKEDEKSGGKVNRFCLQLSATDPVFGNREKNDCGSFFADSRNASSRVEAEV
jgi:hypothetical protein